MEIIIMIAAAIIFLVIQYYIICSAVRKGTLEVRELLNELLAYKIMGLKKMNVITEYDIEEREKERKIEILQKKLKRGMIAESEFRKRRNAILEE